MLGFCFSAPSIVSTTGRIAGSNSSASRVQKNRHSIYAETTVVPLTWCQQLVLPFPLLANSLGREALLFLLRPSNLGDVENELKIENTMGAVSELII
jgi:hypothetical protein